MTDDVIIDENNDIPVCILNAGVTRIAKTLPPLQYVSYTVMGTRNFRCSVAGIVIYNEYLECDTRLLGEHASQRVAE
jgi:hypothetical protein